MQAGRWKDLEQPPQAVPGILRKVSVCVSETQLSAPDGLWESRIGKYAATSLPSTCISWREYERIPDPGLFNQILCLNVWNSVTLALFQPQHASVRMGRLRGMCGQ